MKEKKQKKKNANKGLILIAILLIAIIVATASVGMWAWAKYRSGGNGEAEVVVAKWHIELKPGKVVETEPAVFAITRTDGYTHVAEGTLAPGTFGVIPIEIDTTETEVLMRVDLTFKLTDCPKNIKFYKTEEDRENNIPLEMTQEEEDGKNVSTVVITRYYSLDENSSIYVDQVHNESIYWGWAYETLDENDSAVAGDAQDRLDNNKTTELVITAVGTQVLEIPPEYAELTEGQKLAQALQNPYDDNNVQPSPQDMFTYEPTGETVTVQIASNTENGVRIASKDGVRLAETTKTYGTARITGFNYGYFEDLCGSSDSGYGFLYDLSRFDGNVVIPAITRIDGQDYIITEFVSCCSDIKDVYGRYLNRLIKKVILPSSVMSIGDNAFEDCSGLTSVIIPNSVTRIGNVAFGYCSGLTSVTIPNSVTSIGADAFMECRGLTSVTIPNSVTSIGADAFMECRGLTSVTIPNSVKSIRSHAFYRCSGLTSITIPSSVTSIGNWVFWGCSGLTVINVEHASKPSGWDSGWSGGYNSIVNWGYTIE